MQKLCTKSNKHEIWNSGTLGGKKSVKPQNQKKRPVLCILQTRIGFHGNAIFFFYKIESVIYRWKGNFLLNKKLAYAISWKSTYQKLLGVKVWVMTSSKYQKILYFQSTTCYILLESKFSREQKTCLGHIMKIKLSKVIKHLSLCNRIIKIPKNFDIFKYC